MSDLHAALLAVQKAAPTLPKDKTATVQTKAGGSYQYRYTDLATVVETVGPLLSEHGLVWTSFPAHDDGTPVLRYTLTHAESGESIEAEMPLLLGGQIDSQGLGSALTYARRYSLCAVLNLVADDDDDGKAASGRGGTNTSRVGTGNGFASDKQQQLIKTLITQKGVSMEQLMVMLEQIGADVEPLPGWVGKLSGGRDGAASALISWLKEEDRKIPSLDQPSDVPDAGAGEFEHPPADPSGTPLDDGDDRPRDLVA